MGDEGFQHKDLGEIELIDTTAEELMEDNLMEVSASSPLVPDGEEREVEAAVPENKLTDGLAEGLHVFKIAFNFLCDMNPSMIQVLKTKQSTRGRRIGMAQKHF